MGRDRGQVSDLNFEVRNLDLHEPTTEELASMRSPVPWPRADGRGADAPGHWRYESAESPATRLSTNLVELPGVHMHTWVNRMRSRTYSYRS